MANNESNGCHLLALPHELLHCILREIDLFSLGPLSATCSTLNSFIHGNDVLFRDLYLNNYDDPQERCGSQFNWELELTKLIRLHKILLSTEIYQKSSNIVFVSDTICSLLKLAHFVDPDASQGSGTGKNTDRSQSFYAKMLVSRNVSFLSEMFNLNSNVDTILCGSSLFEHAGTDMQIPASTEPERQLSAKLHCLYGVPVCATADDDTATHPYARAKVYDLRRYTEKTMWGPFMDDGSQNVDWEKVEAVMVDLAYNIDLFHHKVNGQFPIIWSAPWRAAVPYSYVGGPITNPEEQPCDELALRDPYNVTGTWMRIVCFLDYRDFFRYNFSTDDEPEKEEVRPINTEEAIRIMCMKFRVVDVEPPGESDGQELPVVHFAGTSRSLHAAWDPNANSEIRGSVRLTPEGEVRWTTFSIYEGQERWRTEAIQVGGVQSKRGVFGHWFDKAYDARGPAGPTAFWKLTNQIVEGRQPRFHY